MRKIVISVVSDKDSPRFGKLAIHVEEGRMESETWSPSPGRKFELLKPLLNELISRSEEFRDPLVTRTISDLRIVEQELGAYKTASRVPVHLFGEDLSACGAGSQGRE